MNILILGGTRFVGPALVNEAVARGHSVTLFHRGRTSASPGAAPLPPGVISLIGNRDEDLSSVAGKPWDAIIDTCGYLPAQLRRTVRMLEGGTGRYVFISSISVYAENGAVTPEDAPLQTLAEGPEPTSVTNENYGALKAACEQVVRDALGDRALLLRPGVIAGAYDPTSRFTFWPARLQASAELHVPDCPDAPIQWVDVKDVASAALLGLEQNLSGAFNLVANWMPLQTFLETCVRVANPQARLIPLPLRALEAAGAHPWEKLPLFLPAELPISVLSQTPNQKALAHGMTFRALEHTLEDVLAWWAELPESERIRRISHFMDADMESRAVQHSREDGPPPAA